MKDNNRQNSTFIKVILLATLVFFAFAFCYLTLFLNKSDVKSITVNPDNKRIFIKDNVLLKASDGSEMRVNLPKKLNSDKDYSYSFIPKSITPDKKLFMYIKGSYHTFKLCYKDEIIYEKKPIDTGFIKSGGDYVRIIMIPDKFLGKELSISFKPLKKSTYGILIPYVVLGTHDDLILYSYLDDLDILLVSAFLLLFSLESFLFQIVLFFYKKFSTSSLLSSLYALVLALYIVIRTPAIYFLIPRGSFIYVLDYMLFLLLPITIAMFMINVAKKKGSKKAHQILFDILITLFIANFIIQVTLTMLGYTEFMDFQKLSQIAVVLSALVSVIIPFGIDDFLFKRTLSISMAALMLVLIFLLKVYLTTYRIKYMTILGIVGAIFITFQYLVLMKMYSYKYTISYRTKLNKKIALTDNLTRLNNRNAFEKDLKRINQVGQKIMLIIIDINNLKEINDHLGHNSGDYLIKNIGEILTRTKIKFTKTTPYRIGGDEFVIIGQNVDDTYAKRVLDFINNKSKEFKAKNKNTPLSYGIGYEVTRIDEDFNIDNLMEIVDKKMYEDKELKKRTFSKEPLL